MLVKCTTHWMRILIDLAEIWDAGVLGLWSRFSETNPGAGPLCTEELPKNFLEPTHTTIQGPLNVPSRIPTRQQRIAEPAPSGL